MVRFGRASSVLSSSPLTKFVKLNREMMMVLGPSCWIRPRSDWSKPRIIDVMATMDVMPITTPSTVRPERILFVRTVSKAMTTTSRSRP